MKHAAAQGSLTVRRAEEQDSAVIVMEKAGSALSAMTGKASVLTRRIIGTRKTPGIGVPGAGEAAHVQSAGDRKK